MQLPVFAARWQFLTESAAEGGTILHPVLIISLHVCSKPRRLGSSVSPESCCQARISQVSKTLHLLRPRENCWEPHPLLSTKGFIIIILVVVVVHLIILVIKSLLKFVGNLVKSI